jgi:cytochrome c-type biogenesis protein CcmE
VGVTLLGAIAFLTLGPSGETEGVLEYVYVDEVVGRTTEFAAREFKVHGVVVEGSVRQKKNESGDYMFEIEHEGKRLKVHYTDMVPDTFAEGGEVVLTGHLNVAGDTVESSEMSAKCPSKYEEEQRALPTS